MPFRSVMTGWCPTDAGFELLGRTGLDKRIDESWEEIRRLKPLTAILDDFEIKDRLKDDTPPARRKAIENWAYNDKRNRFIDGPNSFFIVSGTVTDALLSKDEIQNPQQFGVESISQLDGLLASYVETKHRDKPLMSEYYVWRSPGLKTRIYGDSNGDLRIHQIDTKPRAFGLFGDLPAGGISASYGYWSTLVAVALKYADTVGIEIPEAKNWQEFMKKYRWNGKISRPSLGDEGQGFAQDYSEEIIAQLPDKVDNVALKKNFFGQMRPHASQNVIYYPIINEEQQLMICVSYQNAKSEKADVKIKTYGENLSFAKSVIIPKEDAGHLFKGAVHGIMTNQSRTHPHYLAYMIWSYDQLKAGKSADEIDEEGRGKYGN